MRYSIRGQGHSVRNLSTRAVSHMSARSVSVLLPFVIPWANVFRPKLKKWPNGYPGDKEETYPLAERRLRAIRTHVRWECHSCKAMFKDHEKTCGSCQHQLCDQCKRHPPKRVKPPPDEAVVKSLEERLAKVNLKPAT